MATPLRDVLHAALSDADTRTALERAPGDYLAEHGWQDLDAADLQEAMLILADGAATIEAVVWVTGADAIEATDGDVGQALSTALAAMQVPPDPEDPATLDGFDDDGRDPPSSDGFDAAIGDDDPDELDGELATDDAWPPGTWQADRLSAGDVDRPAGDPPVEAPGIGIDLVGDEHDDQLTAGPLDDQVIDIHEIGSSGLGAYGTETADTRHDEPDADWDGLI